MPKKCIVSGCRGNYDKYSKVSVFQFPNDADLRQLWISTIFRDSFEPTSNSVVCEKHFRSEFIITWDSVTRPDGSVLTMKRSRPKLTKDAYPSIGLFKNRQSHLSEAPSRSYSDTLPNSLSVEEKELAELKMMVDPATFSDVGPRDVEFSSVIEDDNDSTVKKSLKNKPTDSEKTDDQASFPDVRPIDMEFSVSDDGPTDVEFSIPIEDNSDGMKMKLCNQETVVEEPGQTLCAITGTPTDQLSADHSPLVHKSGHTFASLLSANKHHVCQRCSAAFVMFNSLRVHMVTFHGENLHTELPVSSTPDGYSGGGVDFDCGVKRDVDYGVKREVDCGVKREVDCSVKREVDCSVKREIDCSVKREVDYGILREVKIKEEGNDSDKDCDKNIGYCCDEREVNHVNEGHRVTENLKADYHLDKGEIYNSHQQFVCHVCSMVFSLACDLKKHKFIHTTHKQFVCDICSKVFTRARVLRKHKMIHTGLKPFVCDVCKKAFTWAYNLKRHKLIHNGHNHSCDICSETFSVAVNLKIHKLLHTGLT